MRDSNNDVLPFGERARRQDEPEHPDAPRLMRVDGAAQSLHGPMKLSRLNRLFDTFVAAIFSATWTKAGHALYLLGCFLLAEKYYVPFVFSESLAFWDWAKELFYLDYLRSSLIHSHTIPSSFVTIPSPLAGYPAFQPSTSYWANPEVITASPLIPLLFVLPAIKFVKAFFAVHVLAGMWGVWLLARRLALPPYAAVLLLFVTVFNPWMLQHLALGYTPHITFLLCPAVVALLAGPSVRIRDLIAASALASIVVYEGGLHVFNWLCGAIALFSLVRTALLPRLYLREAWPFRLLPFFAGTMLLSAPKLVATAICYSGWTRLVYSHYDSPHDLWGLLTDAAAPLFRLPDALSRYHTNFFDASVLVSAPFVVVSIAALLAAISWKKSGSLQRSLACTAIILVILGWGDVWKIVSGPVPFLRSERYPARFLFIAVELTIALVLLQLNTWIDGKWWRAWSLLVLVPLLVSYHQRNLLCLAEATSYRPSNDWNNWPPQNLEASVVAKNGQSLQVTAHVTPSSVVIDVPDGAQLVSLPWARFGRHDTFVRGAKLLTAHGATNFVVAPVSQRVEVVFRRFAAGPLALGGLACFALFFVALHGIRRRRNASSSTAAHQTQLA